MHIAINNNFLKTIIVGIKRLKMQKKVFQILSALVVCFLFQSFVSINKSYQTECVTLESDGYLTLKIWDSRKGQKYKSSQAQKDALHAILFSGVSSGTGCATQTPMLRNSENKENFKGIERRFFSRNGDWERFIRSNTIKTTLPSTIGAKNWKVYQVSVSKNELRKYLEEQKIIKSLTNGF